jgi:hypothetical protein
MLISAAILFPAVRAWCNAHVVETAVVPEAPAGRRRRSRWRLWTALAAVALVCAAAVVTTAVRHYRYAPALRCACSFAWAGADAGRITNSQADAHEQMTVPATGARQAFLVEIVNDSSVTQTILGLPEEQRMTVYRPSLQAGLQTGSQGLDEVHYSATPLAIPPHGQAALRYSFDSVCLARAATLFWDQLALRVRVGAFTRTESVDLADTAMAVRGTSASAACH